MKNKRINIAAVSEIAKALAELKDQMVFVGGAIVSLYADTESDEELRETFDIDITSVKVINYTNYTLLLERLAELGFHPDPKGHAICSLQYHGIAVDVMPSEDGPLGPANKWYKIGFKDLRKVMAEKEEIQILSAPCFLATKFEAFNDRGDDYRTSHDFEDIIYVLDNRTSIVEEIKNSSEKIRQFLINQFKKIAENKYKEEILSVHLDPNTIEERYLSIVDKIDQIVNSR